MSGKILQENRTLAVLAAEAAEYAAGERTINAKALAKRLGIFRPTAVKLLCLLDLMGLLGERGRKGFEVLPCARAAEEIRARAERLPQDYLPLSEDEKEFEKAGYDGYMFGTLLPALKIGITYGSISVIYLQRKMSVGYERAHEIYDLLGAGGFFDKDDEINPGRKLMTVGYSDYDRIYMRLEGRR